MMAACSARSPGMASTSPSVCPDPGDSPKIMKQPMSKRQRIYLLSGVVAAVCALVLTMHAEAEYVVRAVRAGAAGFLLKDSPASEVVAAVRALAAGRAHFGGHAAAVLAQQMQAPKVALDDPYRDLTAREREVFHLVVEGLTTKEIARKLDTSVKTAENHRARVLEKTGVRNTAELVRYAVRHGLLD